MDQRVVHYSIIVGISGFIGISAMHQLLMMTADNVLPFPSSFYLVGFASFLFSLFNVLLKRWSYFILTVVIFAIETFYWYPIKLLPELLLPVN